MAVATNLGFPRIGAQRELKRALERFWSRKDDLGQLLAQSTAIQQANWKLQTEAGLDVVPCCDFSLYDHVLDTALMLGAVPPRFSQAGFVPDDHGMPENDAPLMFAMARGVPRKNGAAAGVAAMEMTKWFDTNYHYIVPELTPDLQFRLRSGRVLQQLRSAGEAGISARPVILGPVSFVLLSKVVEYDRGAGDSPPAGDDRTEVPQIVEPRRAHGIKLELARRLVPPYRRLLSELAAQGADWVQIDEPALVLDLDEQLSTLYREVYAELTGPHPRPRILAATYFGGLAENLESALALSTEGLHLDLVRAPEQLDAALNRAPEQLTLSLGLVDGRNVWKTDLSAAVEKAAYAVRKLGSQRLMIAPSCSLLHSPVDLDLETDLDGEIRDWMAYAKQKAAEVAAITEVLNGGGTAVRGRLERNHAEMKRRWTSRRIHKPAVKRRMDRIGDEMFRRRGAFDARRAAQSERVELPLLPTTTIGSFPQTNEIRTTRAAYRRGEISEAEYVAFQRERIAETVRFQEQVGLEVLVHGESERNDMVEYFGEQLEGFLQTKHGWVQSYGSRCVKPPVIYGDVQRPRLMTVDWITYAQSLTEKPVKGMLTGPVTMLQWSFVRDDQPRAETCRQLAMVLREEIQDLENAGIAVIQVDEPALREGLPLRGAERQDYLDWAVGAFRLATGGAADATQIHTHMCYSEFNEIIESIAAMDADVISIEASRSKMELLEVFKEFRYPNQIGPGVYDIHSPLIPSVDEIERLIEKAIEVLPAENLWVNPDCGLKTRRWEEVEPALRNMVTAAHRVRAKQHVVLR